MPCVEDEGQPADGCGQPSFGLLRVFWRGVGGLGRAGPCVASELRGGRLQCSCGRVLCRG